MCVAASLMWVRGYWRGDSVRLMRFVQRPGESPPEWGGGVSVVSLCGGIIVYGGGFDRLEVTPPDEDDEQPGLLRYRSFEIGDLERKDRYFSRPNQAHPLGFQGSFTPRHRT